SRGRGAVAMPAAGAIASERTKDLRFMTDGSLEEFYSIVQDPKGRGTGRRNIGSAEMKARRGTAFWQEMFIFHRIARGTRRAVMIASCFASRYMIPQVARLSNSKVSWQALGLAKWSSAGSRPVPLSTAAIWPSISRRYLSLMRMAAIFWSEWP